MRYIKYLLLFLVGCNEPVIHANTFGSSIPTVTIPEAPPPKEEVKWLDQVQSADKLDSYCLVVRFYNHKAEDDHLNNILNDDRVIKLINESYLPISWEDSFIPREKLDDDELNANFSGLLIVPLVPHAKGIKFTINKDGDLEFDINDLITILATTSCNT